QILQYTAPAAGPVHFDSHAVGQGAGSKDPHRLITGEITTAADDLLALHGHGAAINPDFGANALGIVRHAFKHDGDARPGCVVTINSGTPVEIVYHHIHVPVVVQIGQTHSL